MKTEQSRGGSPTATFYLLQIRPIVDNKEVMEEDLTLVEQKDTILSSTSVLGHGIVTDVQDIIYVKTVLSTLPTTN